MRFFFSILTIGILLVPSIGVLAASDQIEAAYAAGMAKCDTEYGATIMKQTCDGVPGSEKGKCEESFGKNLEACKTNTAQTKDQASKDDDTKAADATAAAGAAAAASGQSGSAPAAAPTGGQAVSTYTPAAPLSIPTPKLSIPFPTLPKLTNVPAPAAQGEEVIIPWIGEYFAAAYQYLVGIAVIIAIILIMVSGLQWSASAGSSEKVSAAKKRMTDAVMGLTLALGSYLILYTINPALVQFKGLNISSITPIPFEEYDDSLDESQVQQNESAEADAQGSGEPTTPGTANAVVKAMASGKALYPPEKCGDPKTMVEIINQALANPLCQGPCNCAPTVVKLLNVSGCGIPRNSGWGMVPTFKNGSTAKGKIGIEQLKINGKQMYQLQKVSTHGEPSPGDIIFTNSTTHVGMYYGNGMMVDSGTSDANWKHCKTVAPNCPTDPSKSFNNGACNACGLIKQTSPIGYKGVIYSLRYDKGMAGNMAAWSPVCGATSGIKPDFCTKCATNQCFAKRKFLQGTSKSTFDTYAHYIGNK